MSKSDLIFVTDVLAADSEAGLKMMERVDLPEEVRDAVKLAFEGSTGESKKRALIAAAALLENSDDSVKAAGRLLKWSAGNYRI